MCKTCKQIFKVHVTHIVPNLMIFSHFLLKLYCLAIFFSFLTFTFWFYCLFLHFKYLQNINWEAIQLAKLGKPCLPWIFSLQLTPLHQ